MALSLPFRDERRGPMAGARATDRTPRLARAPTAKPRV